MKSDSFTASPSVHTFVRRAVQRLVDAGIHEADAELDAEVLARHALGWDRAAFLTRRHQNAPDFEQRFIPLVDRRARREPVAQIVGLREFWNRSFEVTSDVLTPRPETEIIIEQAIEVFRGQDGPGLIVDAGTGSGCLAVTLALEFPAARVVATDISPAALAVARRNAERNGAASRVEFQHAEWLAGIEDADLIVSNPPYVESSSAPAMPPEVRNHEPAIALFGGGVDGLDATRAFLSEADERVARGGWVMMEFGCGQEELIRGLVERLRRLALIRICPDLQGIPRTAILRCE